jgi:iron complex outermembrane recepter protein
MTSGLSGTRQVNDRSGSVFLVPDYQAHGVGLYTLHTWIRGRVTLTAGLRYDIRWLVADVRDRRSAAAVRQERTFRNLAGSVGLQWRASSALTASMNLGSGWRPPQVNELYANDVHHGVALYEIGDSLLAPERNVAVDGTIRLAARGVDVEVTGYAHRFDGYIYSLPDPANPTVTVRGTFPTFRFTQHDAIIAGADARATVALDATWSILATASVVRGTDLQRDLPLFLMPADRMRLGVHAHLPDIAGIHDAYVDVGLLGVRRQQRFVAGEDYADPPAGYALVDASTGGTIHLGSLDVRFSLTCANVLGQAYRDYLSRFRYVATDPGRDIILRIHVPFNH